MTRTPFAAAALLALAAGCSLNKMVADNMGATFRDATVAFNREGSVKHARAAAPALLKMLDGFIVSSPENQDLLLRGAEMNATFAFGLIEEDDPDWARELYRKALDYGKRALRSENGDLAKALEKDEASVRAAVAKVKKGDDAIPPLFWAAFAWGGFINVSRQDQRAIADLPKVVAVMERLCEIAPGFYHGGPHMFLAAYYSSRGSMLGGDLGKSAQHFAVVMRQPGGMVGAHAPVPDILPAVLYARFYCVALGEKDAEAARKKFTETLAAVIAMPDVPGADNRLQNAIARERAKKLLPQLDDLILPPLPPDEPVNGGKKS